MFKVSKKKLAYTFLCLFLVISLPYLLVYLGWIPNGLAIIAQILLSPLILVAIFTKSSFRIGILITVFLAFFSIYKGCFSVLNFKISII